MTKYHLTQESLDKFKQELDDLHIKLEEVIQNVATAREQGDLSENSEYQLAKSEQGMINNRINDLDDIIKNHVLIDESARQQMNTVDLGSVIHIQNVASGNKRIYKLVGTLEVNPFENKISTQSDIGRSLFGKIAGEEVVLPSEEGVATYKITAIE